MNKICSTCGSSVQNKESSVYDQLISTRSWPKTSVNGSWRYITYKEFQCWEWLFEMEDLEAHGLSVDVIEKSIKEMDEGRSIPWEQAKMELGI